MRSALHIVATATLVAGVLTAGTVSAAQAAQAAPALTSPATASAQAAQAASAFVASRPSILHASAGDSFTAHAPVSSAGLQYVAYDRTYRGLPVVGGDFVVVSDASGQIKSTSIAQTQAIGTLPLIPTLTQAAAETIAATQVTSPTGVEGAHLVVVAFGAPRLAWETVADGVTSDGPTRVSVDVDAKTGAVLNTQQHVLYGTGTSAWNGPNPVHIDTSGAGASFSMTDPTIHNLSCQDFNTHVTLTGTDDVWGDGNAANEETGCVDAMFGAQTEFKMLAQWDGRSGMDGAGGAWPIRIGLNDENAYYDGTQVAVGHNTVGQWIGALDVIAHEMGHGVDDHTPGGISGSGTQEFVADTFGAATEWFANEPAPYDTPDFTVGEKVNLVGAGPIRYMYNPSIVGDANCYSSSIPNQEVHAAAGPGNHWFYLITEGTNPTNGQPTSPTCNGTAVTGLGIQTAERIMYNAMLMKTTGASYLKYRVWTLQAAKNLFPNDCGAFNTVKAAWDAVSVPAQAGEPTCAPPAGPSDMAFVSTAGSLWTKSAGGAVNLNQPVMPGTSPSIVGLPGGGFEIAFQATSGLLWEVGTVINFNTQLGMMAGTSPSIALAPSTAGGFQVAFQANTGYLYIQNLQTGGINQGFQMMAGTSPSIVMLANGGHETAFQAPNTLLWEVGTQINFNTQLGMKSGTSPSITTATASAGNFRVAFQANTGNLWMQNLQSGGVNQGFGMMAGTSPSIVELSNGGWETAFQANTGILWEVGTVINFNTQLGMKPGTSPSIAKASAAAGLFRVAFQADFGNLYEQTLQTGGLNQGVAMAAGTNPAEGEFS